MAAPSNAVADLVEALRAVAPEFGRAFADAAKSTQQREHEADTRRHEAAQAARLAVPALVELPEIGKGKALAVLDQVLPFNLRHQYTQLENLGQGHERVHHGPAVLKVSVRVALGARAVPGGGKISANTCRWSEAPQLASLLRALEARYAEEVARYSRGERATEPMKLGDALASPLVRVRVEGGRSGEHRSVPIPDAPGAW